MGGAVVPTLASAAGLPSVGAAAAPCPEDDWVGAGDDPGVCAEANPTANMAVQENKKPVLICVPCIEGSPLGRQTLTLGEAPFQGPIARVSGRGLLQNLEEMSGSFIGNRKLRK